MYQQNQYQAWSKSRMLMYQQTPEAKSRTPVENVDVSTKSALGFIPKMTLLIHQWFSTGVPGVVPGLWW